MTDDEIPWRSLGKRACPAVAADRQTNPNGTLHIEPVRCDLVRGHRDSHRAERGMYDLLWDDELRTG